MQLKNFYFKCFPECFNKRDLCIFYMIYNVKCMINGTQVTCHQCLVKIWILWGFSCHKEAHALNTLRLRQNRHHFADDIVKCIFFNENVWFPIKISHKFVPRGPISNIPALVQMMPWHHAGDKPLSESMLISLLMHICITRPQWVKCIISRSLTEWNLFLI